MLSINESSQSVLRGATSLLEEARALRRTDQMRAFVKTNHLDVEIGGDARRKDVKKRIHEDIIAAVGRSPLALRAFCPDHTTDAKLCPKGA